MLVFRHLREHCASALGMGLSVSILVFASESLNCKDGQIIDSQFSLTIFLQITLEFVQRGIRAINIL